MYNASDQIPISVDNIPCPFHYSAFFSSLEHCENKCWYPIQEFKEIQKGDLFGYLPCKYVPKKISEIPTKRTGMHLGIIEKVIKVQNEQIELLIIDCTRIPHCVEDSRSKNGKGGVGKSPLTIYIKEEGAILQWGTNKEKLKKHLFFGRLKSIENA